MFPAAVLGINLSWDREKWV